MSTHLNPDDIDLLEKLALGLLVHPGNSQVSKPRIFLGKIPEHFPIQIPVSEQSRVLGTLARSKPRLRLCWRAISRQKKLSAFTGHNLPLRVGTSQKIYGPSREAFFPGP